jgi:hypothetical protein
LLLRGPLYSFQRNNAETLERWRESSLT